MQIDAERLTQPDPMAGLELAGLEHLHDARHHLLGVAERQARAAETHAAARVALGRLDLSLRVPQDTVVVLDAQEIVSTRQLQPRHIGFLPKPISAAGIESIVCLVGHGASRAHHA